jgi:hypothetical protein
MIWVQEQAISEKTELANVYLKILIKLFFRFGGLEKVLECRLE